MNEIGTTNKNTDISSVVDSQVSVIVTSSKMIDNALTRAQQVKEKAERASEMSAGWSIGGTNKKEAIKALQEVAVDQSSSMMSLVDANKEMFMQLQKMSKATQQLFVLGVSNTATIRVIIDGLKKKLEVASKEKLSESAQNEIINLIQQLQSREDLISKYDNLSQTLKKLATKVRILETDSEKFSGIDRLKEIESSLTGMNTAINKEKLKNEQFDTDIKNYLSSSLSQIDNKILESKRLLLDVINGNKKELCNQMNSQISLTKKSTEKSLDFKIAEVLSTVQSKIVKESSLLDEKIKKVQTDSEERIKNVLQLTTNVTTNLQNQLSALEITLTTADKEIEMKLSEGVKNLYSKLEQAISIINAEINNTQKANAENIKNVLGIIEEANKKQTAQIKNVENTISTATNQLDCKLTESIKLLQEEIEKRIVELVLVNEKQYDNITSQLSSLVSKIDVTEKAITAQLSQLTEQMIVDKKNYNTKFYIVIGFIALVALIDILLKFFM